jgi:hypothetical protein
MRDFFELIQNMFFPLLPQNMTRDQRVAYMAVEQAMDDTNNVRLMPDGVRVNDRR